VDCKLWNGWGEDDFNMGAQSIYFLIPAVFFVVETAYTIAVHNHLLHCNVSIQIIPQLTGIHRMQSFWFLDQYIDQALW
jgi:hypothetical protein